MTRELLHHIVSVKFAVIVLMFLMPFATVSCGGGAHSFSGMDMAFGPDKDKEGMWQMLIVLFSAVAGALSFFWKDALVHYLQAALGALGAVLMSVVKHMLSQEAAEKGFSIQYDFAFVLSWILFLLAILVSLYALNISGRRPLPSRKEMGDIGNAGQEAIHHLSYKTQQIAAQAKQYFSQVDMHAGKTIYNPAYSTVLRATDYGLPDIQILSDSKTVVGRSSNSSTCLNNTYVSGKHLELMLDDNGQVLVRDLGSTNGTYIDGMKLTEGQYHPLRPGQRLVIGSEDAVYTL